MDAVGVTEEGEDGRLVERHPVLDTIAEVRGDRRGVVGEPAHDLGVGEAAAVLQACGRSQWKRLISGWTPASSSASTRRW
jgi:hypothetical protein